MSDGYVTIGQTSDLKPGKMKCVDVNGKKYLLANVDGTYYVADDMCTHEDASLSTGNLTDNLVKCPLHGSRFDLFTGKVLDDPAEDNLKIYRVKVEGENILADLSS